MINDVRKKKLKLRPVTYLSGSHSSESDIPHGYIWSPHLVPKPKGTFHTKYQTEYHLLQLDVTILIHILINRSIWVMPISNRSSGLKSSSTYPIA